MIDESISQLVGVNFRSIKEKWCCKVECLFFLFPCLEDADTKFVLLKRITTCLTKENPKRHSMHFLFELF